MMELKPRVLEQHIAVFGESGSGKTVLVSCFYGAMLQHEFTKLESVQCHCGQHRSGQPTVQELPGHEGFGAPCDRPGSHPPPTHFQ